MISFNNTTQTGQTGDAGIPIFGYPGPVFYVIHIVALASCSVSSVCSIGILTYLFVSEKRSSNRSFYKWTRGERLVVYIAAYDLAFSVAHTIDHAYILAAISHPVDIVCRIFALFVIHGFTGQWLVIFYSAISAFSLVVMEKQMKMGRRDWRLLTFANIIPGTFCILGVIFEYLGPGGTWCAFTRNWLGNIMSNVNTGMMLVVFFTSMFCYIAIWIKIMLTTRKVTSEQQNRSNRSGKIMMVFVLAFLTQWWPYATHTIWGYFSVPDLWIIVAVVFFCNIGGVLNAFAYTIIRRKYIIRHTGTANNPKRNTSS